MNKFVVAFIHLRAIMNLTGPPAPLTQRCAMWPRGGVLFLWVNQMELKRPTTLDEQIALIKSRNCEMGDENYCKDVLQRVNYYRFSAYFLPFRDELGNYREGTTFDRVYRIYEFDRKMRHLLLSLLEEVEISLRMQLSYFHAHKYGALGYEQAANFNKKHRHDRFMQQVKIEIERNKNALFVKHHMLKYGGKFPIWVIVELFTFGMLSHFYADLKRGEAGRLASELFDVSQGNVVSWLKCCTDLRNVCAHYGRLYYTTFPSTPATPSNSDFRLGEKLFDYILIVKRLYPDKVRWYHETMPALQALIEEYSTDIHLPHIGFPTNWESVMRMY